MKRILTFCFVSAFVLVVFLSLTANQAYAYIPSQCNNPPDQCTCFVQLGDKGFVVERIIDKLKGKGYINKTDRKDEFTPEVREAVIAFQRDNGLECTGWMDDDTLNALLRDTLPDKTIIYTKANWNEICYVPTDGGQKYHQNPTCSGMYNPRMISRVNAESLDIHPCQKDSCIRCTPLTYTSLGLEPRILPDEYYAADEDSQSRSTFQIMEVSGNTLTQRTYSPGDTESFYIGNKNTHIFHRETCSSVKSMSEKNKITIFSREEAIEAGYKPCSRCNP